MDVQIQNAIEIAWNSRSDQNLKAQAFEFLNQLRTDSSGWQVCLDLFTRSPQTSEVVRVVSLEAINYAVQSLDSASLVYLKDNLLEYTKRTYGGLDGQRGVDSSGLQNKLAQTFTYIFIALYKQGWETFIDDFLGLLSCPNGSQGDNIVGVTFYLRLLNAIHEEIADVLVARPSAETKRNTDIKDVLRARDIPKVAGSWKSILNQWKDKNDAVLESCLKVIGHWVSWIDISLVVNQDFLHLLFPLAGRQGKGSEDKVRNAAIDTFTEIVGKKMKTADKIEMIIFLNLGNVVSQLVSSTALHEFRSTSNYDTDLAEAVAKLVNTATFDIVKALEDAQADPQVRARAGELLQTFLPLLLRFLSDEYDEICCTVIPSLTDLLTFLRKNQPLPTYYSAILPPTLNAIITKMRYDETSSWGEEDEQTDEAEFQDLRKRLHNLQKSFAAVDEPLYIEVLSNVVANTFKNFEQSGGGLDWRDLDLALHEMYLFGELALPNSGLGTKSQPSTVAAERLSAMMVNMLESGIATFNHPAIQLQYMEICVRYHAFFDSQPNYIPQVLEHFVRLVHGNHIRLKTRSWYLFHRFVKHLRTKIGSMAETVISAISDLLNIKAEVPKEDSGNDDMSSDESDHSADAVFNSQLHLFEAIGAISSTPNTPVDKQALYVRSVMDPLFTDLERHLVPAKAGDAQALLQVHHNIMALGTLAYGFAETVPGGSSAPHKVPAEQVSMEFTRVAEAILIALEATKFNIDVRTASRFAFSRLVGVLGVRILPQLPRWIDGLLSERSSNDEMAMFLRLLDQVVFSFKTEIYSVLDSLLTPLLQRIFNGLSKPVTGTDDEIQLTELRREYLTFVQIILNNDLGATLITESNQGMFEPLITSVILLAKNVSHGSGNLLGSRLAFSVLTRMLMLWGGLDIAKLGQPTPSSQASSPLLLGFDQFMIERFNPVCWDVLRDQEFRPSSDAQAKQVLVEIAALLQTIYCKTGNMFIEHLQMSYFPSLGMDGSCFIHSMTMTEKKAFTSFLQAFLKQRG